MDQGLSTLVWFSFPIVLMGLANVRSVAPQFSTSRGCYSIGEGDSNQSLFHLSRFPFKRCWVLNGYSFSRGKFWELLYGSIMVILLALLSFCQPRRKFFT